jgi:hypothetical protein
MIDSTTLFNKLWVLESLAAGELKTGRSLVEGPLATAAANHIELKIEYRIPSSKKEFLEVLDLVREEAAKGEGPMLHFECHGSEGGLELENGEFVQWQDLRDRLIAINRACRTHLIIAVAACDGAHLINVAAVLDRAPFWAIIATEGVISAGALERDFGNFYRELFSSMNGDAAIGALNQGLTDEKRRFKFISSAGLFARAYRKYHERYCVGRARQERVEELVTQKMAQSADKELVIGEVRKKIKQELANHDKHFDQLKRRFFFIDEFPENEERYCFTREEILN